MKKPTFKIFSFYNHFVNPQVPIYQKRVFEHFGQSITQNFNNQFSHGDFLNYICQTIVDIDYIIIFDIDCIPTRQNWIEYVLKDLEDKRTIVGAAQTANHINEGKNIYVSPFFFAIATSYLKELNYPDMRMSESTDAGQNLTNVILKENGNIKYWWPTRIEEEMWYLHNEKHNRFGLGTTYNDMIYHAFFSRDDLSTRFLRKCQEVLRKPIFE